MDRTRATLTLTACGLACALYTGFLWFDLPLLDPDEGLHASIAQEMVERGDYVTPRLEGKPFYDKPVLFFWAQAASLRALGMTEAAIRLPGIVFTLLGVLTTALLARRLLGPTAAPLAALFQMSMVLPVALGQFAVHDVALVPWVNLALLGFWEALNSEPPARRIAWFAGAGVWLGLAVLTKGLIGVAFVGLAYGAYLAATRRWRLSLVFGPLAALGVAALVAAPWYAMMIVRNPDYAHYYFVERHLHGFFTSTQRHGDEAWWYYFPLMLGGGLPWIAYLPLAGLQFRSDRRDARPTSPTLLLWCWLGAGLLFLTLAQSKMVTYALPLFPPIALLVAGFWARLLEGSLDLRLRDWAIRSFQASCLLGPIVLPVAMLVVADRFQVEYGALVWALGIALALASWAPLMVGDAAHFDRRFAASGAYLAAVFTFVMFAVMPHVAPRCSAQALARSIEQQSASAREIVLVGDRLGSLVFYLSPEARRRMLVRRISFEELLAPPPLNGPTIVLLPTRMMKMAQRCRDIAKAPYRVVDRYHVYDGALLAPHLRKDEAGGARVARRG